MLTLNNFIFFKIVHQMSANSNFEYKKPSLCDHYLYVTLEASWILAWDLQGIKI